MPNQTTLKNLKRVLKKVEADLKRPAGIEECRERAYSRMDVFGKLHVLTGRVVDFLGLDFLSPLVNKRLAIVYNRVGKKALVDSQKYSNGANKEGASILYIPAKVEDPNKKKIEVKTIEDIEAMVENLKTEELEFTIEEKIAEIENDPTLQPAVKELYLEFARRIKCLDEELKIEGEK